MRITIWVTDHPYAQRIAMALKLGLKDDAVLAHASQVSDELIAATDIHIGYGVVRGMGDIYRRIEKAGKHWFVVDLGYFDPAHFDGYYRIAYKGTQSRYNEKIQSENSRSFAPWKQGGEFALICPPTDYVAEFFGVKDAAWVTDATAQAKALNLTPKIRRKGDAEKLDDALASAGAVITYNSSVAWLALEKGIPAISNIQNSTVGSWHGDIKTLGALRALNRDALFRFMLANQLTLLEIQQGKILPILKNFITAL